MASSISLTGFSLVTSVVTFYPPRPKIILRDLGDALQFRLGHQLGSYNGVQRLLYMGVIIVICLAVVTGLSIWKPVQLCWLTGQFGRYPLARPTHLTLMALILV